MVSVSNVCKIWCAEKANEDLCEESKARVRLCREEGMSFKVRMKLWMGCVMLSWLLNLFLDGILRVEGKNHKCKCLRVVHGRI